MNKHRIIQISIAALMTILIILFDQLTKLYVEKNMEVGESIVFIKGFINWTFYYNDGIAFSMFAGKMKLFACVSLVTGCIIAFFMKDFDLTKKRNRIYSIALTFILGGCFGNMIDRFFRSDLGVVDFIEPTFINFATFNVADSFLTIGAILLGIHFIFIYQEPKKKEEKTPVDNTDEIIIDENNKEMESNNND